MTYRDEVEEALSAVEELRGDQIKLISLGVKLGIEAAVARAVECAFHAREEGESYGDACAREIRDLHPGYVLVSKP